MVSYRYIFPNLRQKWRAEMPIYEYQCTECRKTFEFIHMTGDTSPEASPCCSAPAKRIETTDYDEHQKSHCSCIVCGTHNPISLKLKFSVQPDGSVFAQFKGNSLLQGYRGILHGGIVATLLDATMTHCLFYNGIQALTGDLQIRFLKPVPFNAQLQLRAKITTSFRPLYKVDSELTYNKQPMARAQAKFMETSEAIGYCAQT